MSGNSERIMRMIESDRYGFANDSKDIIRGDIEAVLSEYFYLPSHVKIQLDKNGDRFDLKISAENCSMRNFNVLK